MKIPAMNQPVEIPAEWTTPRPSPAPAFKMTRFGLLQEEALADPPVGQGTAQLPAVFDVAFTVPASTRLDVGGK